ncbi:MAG: AfsR/SARP family transcriptional regulator, partial [Actinobacteria bacterium]|nr:AfsR/SARP family transcriptional regulator [Actinomycetota bacterium]
MALVLRAREVVSAGALAELVWADAQPRNPVNALQLQVSYLRKRLGGGSAGQPVVTRPGGYVLMVDDEDIDARRFEQLVRDAARLAPTDPVRSLDLWETALGLWRGAAFADVLGEPFVVGEATRLEEMRLSAVEERNDVLLTLGRHAELVGELSGLVNEHPLRERLHAQLMLALYRAGRQADALRAFSRARAVLVDELGIDPGPELRRLEQHVLTQD